MATERLRDRKREDTRRRLVEAGHRMIKERGYAETTTSDIAAAAGVTERTFFRHFSSKGDVVIAKWRRRGDALRDAGRQAPDTDQPIEVVRAALHAFTEDLTPDNESSRANARTIWANRPLAVLLLDVVINLEQDIATELARRQGRSTEDLYVRITANASIGVLRAAIRAAFVSEHDGDLTKSIDSGLDWIAPLFAPDSAPSVRSKRSPRTKAARSAELSMVTTDRA